jgi:predicted ABC-type ATPase
MTEKPPPLLLIVLCGPNGAGKSTFFKIMLKSFNLPFVNTDLLATKTFGKKAAEHALDAAKLAEKERQRLISQRSSFIMETVLSDSGGHKLNFFREAQNAGYVLQVFFIGLDSVETSTARVQGRVNSGGHDVPLDRIQARFPRSIENLRVLCGFADELRIFDNSSRRAPYRLVAHLQKGKLLAFCLNPPAWITPLDLPSLSHSHTKQFPF